MQTKRQPDLFIDNSHITVTFEELFYDLIFVIIISKISTLLTNTHNITIGVLLSSLALFLILIISWRTRLIHNNQVHILSNKTKSKMANIKIITYVEIVLMTLTLHSFETMSYKFILAQILIITIGTFFTISQVRENLYNYFEGDSEKFITVIRNVRRGDKQLINIDYITERFGVIVILFLGEILATSFLNIQSTLLLFGSLVLLLLMFNRIMKILNHSKKLIKEEAEKYLFFRQINHYFTMLLINLLIVIVLLESSVHNGNLHIVLLAVSLVTFMSANTHVCRKLNLDMSIWENIYFILLLIVIFTFNYLNNLLSLLLIISPLMFFVVLRIYRRHKHLKNIKD